MAFGNSYIDTEIMIDIETLGTDDDAFVLQICAKAFNLSTGKVTKTFNQIVDLKKMDREKIEVEPATLLFWVLENGETFTDLLKQGSIKDIKDKKAKTYTEKELIVNFHNWLCEFDTRLNLWGNGIAFDNVKIARKFKKYGLKNPIHFRNDRDMRTIVEFAMKKSGQSKDELFEDCIEEGKAVHDAVNDVDFQIRVVCKCYKILMN